MIAKKVLFIAGSVVGDMPGVSGGDVRFIEVAKNWARDGFEIDLLSSEGGRRLCQRLGLEVKLHRLTRSSRSNRLAFLGILFKSLFPPRTLKGFGSGIVYSASEQIYDVVPGFWLKLRNPRKIKLVVAVHWLPPVLWWRRKESTFLNSLLFLLSERAGLFLAGLFADCLLAVSNSTQRQIKKSFCGRFLVKKTVAVKCGVNFEKIRGIVSQVSEKKYDAVFMKRIQAVKGIFDLIEIWEMVVKKLPRALLIIIGSGIDEEEARRRVTEKNLEENIKFLGVIYEDGEKFKKLAESKLFLLTSYEENWAIVIGEAMAAGVPVVSYGLEELKEVWGDNFVAVPIGDKQAFADEVVRLLGDEPTRLALLGKALGFVKSLDWSLIAKEELETLGR